MFDIERMAPVAVVTALMLIECYVFSILVGRERVRRKVPAPATTGDPVFERYFRVHQNTLEQLVLVVPALWMFAAYVSVAGAAGLGFVFAVSRYIYLRGYVADPARRGMGFGIGALVQMVLLLGALGGAALNWAR